jgi:hypothetical protein
MLTAVLKLWGQVWGGPREVDVQSSARMRDAISLAPAKTLFKSMRSVARRPR